MQHSLYTPQDSAQFNKDWMIRLDWSKYDIHSLIGFRKFIDLFSDKLENIFKRVNACKAQKLVLKPFHGCVVSLYPR